MNKKTVLSFLILFAAGFARLFAAYNTLGIPDSAEIRAGLTENWFEAPLEMVRQNKAELFTNDIGQEFQVRMEEDESFFYIFVSPKTTINIKVVSDTKTHIEQKTYYPRDVAGSFVLVRDKLSGKTLSARYYFLKDSGVYVQFTPYGKSALADLVIFGNYAARGAPTGLPFSYYYSSSFDNVMKTTETKIPWNYVLTSQNEYHGVRQMSAVIDEALPQIKYAPDAMYDGDGHLVHVASGRPFAFDELGKTSVGQSLFLSSAGFLKWICDGLVEPIAGAQLKREPLVQDTVWVKDNGHQGVLSQKYKLYFGLNWIRNLASAVISVYANKNYMFNQSGVDVTINPFASSIKDKGVATSVTFIENTGYRIQVLKSLLYVLAATEPDTFYLGAIRETDRSVSPEVTVFNQNAVFFPYFLDDGTFACIVYMNGNKLTLDEFMRLYQSDFLYLTKVKSNEQFFPAYDKK